MFRVLGITFLCLSISVPASSQEREIERSNLPRDLADRLIGIANDPATHRFAGEVEVSADSLIRGDVVVMGSLRLDGRVQGDLIVVGGDVELGAGSEVTGDLTVVGGEVRGDEAARVGGTLIAFERSPPLVPGSTAGPVVLRDRSGVRQEIDRAGSSHFTVHGGSFNRVEGLPIVLGPSFSTGGRDPLRAEAVLIWRSEGRSPFQTDRVGYRAELEQFLFGRRELRVGGGVFSVIDPIEPRGLTDRESSWSTVLFTSDQRDHLERRGARVFVRVTPRAAPVEATVELREERFGVVAPSDPWTLFSSGREWRDQPLVAEGSLRSVVAQATLDTRDDLEEPGGGWLIRARVQEGLGGSLSMPAEAAPFVDPVEAPFPVTPAGLDARFTSALLDVRRYGTVGRGARLNLRGVVGGSPRREVLPPQAQHTLGGPGSLPGHPSFAVDCGAREAVVRLEREGVERTMFPFYGCDRFALFQTEYRGSLGRFFGRGSRSGRAGRPGRREPAPRWVVFFDAGRGWAEGDWGAIARADSPSLYDAGLGLLVGGLGIYWATPLGEHGTGSRFIVRLDRRF